MLEFSLEVLQLFSFYLCLKTPSSTPRHHFFRALNRYINFCVLEKFYTSRRRRLKRGKVGGKLILSLNQNRFDLLKLYLRQMRPSFHLLFLCLSVFLGPYRICRQVVSSFFRRGVEMLTRQCWLLYLWDLGETWHRVSRCTPEQLCKVSMFFDVFLSGVLEC